MALLSFDDVPEWCALDSSMGMIESASFFFNSKFHTRKIVIASVAGNLLDACFQSTTSLESMTASSVLLTNIHSIMTGRADDGGRSTGPDIRVADGRIQAIGRLQALPGERVLDASDCVVYPAWVNTHH